ncbi:MAG: hypothetical protein ACLPRE_06565 [Limisphaerales bacterium]
MKTASTKIQLKSNLVCPNCGNGNRFIEVMAEEAHIVNGRRDYIRLLEAFVDHYVCCDCGETIELDEPSIN